MTLKTLREQLIQITNNQATIVLKDKHGNQINTRKHLPEDFNNTDIIAWSVYSGQSTDTLIPQNDYLTVTLDVIVPSEEDEKQYEIHYEETYEDTYVVTATNKNDATLTFQEKLAIGEYKRPKKCKNKKIINVRNLT